MRIIKRLEKGLNPSVLSKKGLNIFEQIVLSFFFTGLIPVASGTFGSLVAALLYFCKLNFWCLIAVIVFTYFIGVKLSSKGEKILGDDPSFITLDEAVGMWIAFASPIIVPNHLHLFLAFLTFRFFDIFKIFPSNYFDKKKGGVGIMTDDVIAGLYANLTTHLAYIGLSWFPIMSEYLSR